MVMMMNGGHVGAMIAIDAQVGDQVHRSIMWTDSPKIAEWKKSKGYMNKLKEEFKEMGLEVISVRSIESVENELDTL